MTDNNLRCTLLTSSSGKALRPLIQEVAQTTGVDSFELYLLRTVDILGCDNPAPGKGKLLPPRKNGFEERSTRELFNESRNIPHLLNWFVDELTDDKKRMSPRIPAFATFIPEIASPVKKEADEAVDALANLLRFCIQLKRRILNQPETPIGPKDPVIVEFVCGSVVSFSGRTNDNDSVMHRPREKVIKSVAGAVERVVKSVQKDYPNDAWALGAEFEPGLSFTLNSARAVKTFLREVDQLYADESNNIQLKERVGLNFDVGHFMIENIDPDIIDSIDHEIGGTYGDRFVNAHISDHPSAHIKDQAPGRWNSVFRNPKEFDAMIEVYRKAVAKRKPGGLPISRSVSLELEGCGNHAWINQGLGALRHLLS